MVKEDEQKLGPVAVDWWYRLLAAKELVPDCHICKELLDKWQSIHPHQDQEKEDAKLRKKKDDAVPRQSTLIVSRKPRSNPIDGVVKLWCLLSIGHLMLFVAMYCLIQSCLRQRRLQLLTSICCMTKTMCHLSDNVLKSHRSVSPCIPAYFDRLKRA